MPHATATRYLALLEAVFLVRRIPAWSPNLGQRLVKSPKLHLVDSGLACHLVGADAGRFAADRSLFGRMLETFVIGELVKQLSWTDPHASLCHFRAAAGTKVDAVVERPDGTVAAIEVKGSATAGPDDFTGLRGLRDTLGKRFLAGVVLYAGEQVVPFGDRLWLVPLPALWTASSFAGAGLLRLGVVEDARVASRAAPPQLRRVLRSTPRSRSRCGDRRLPGEARRSIDAATRW